MKKISKRIISVLLVAVLLMSTAVISFAAEPQARLYNVYSDGMLFKQNDEVELCGTATPGAEISCALFKGTEFVTFVASNASAEGTFSIKFDSPAGSFDEYVILLAVDGKEFDRLDNIVFGELYLASGQSNMQFNLASSIAGSEMMQNAQVGSKWLRFLVAPVYPEYNGSSEKYPLEPQKEMPGCYWIDGTSGYIYGVSAVAYFFADKLLKDLDMPIGILDSSLGGSSIKSWLSREAIDGDAAVKADFVNSDEYFPAESWSETDHNVYVDMTVNYNKKISPLENFRISGMIWYQGEADIGWQYGRYTRAFDLMQRSYTEYFNYKDGRLPIIFTQLAPYPYGDGTELPNRNIEFSDMQQAHPESIALTTIYDVPLTYNADTHAIHPRCKKPVGEKMAFAAEGLVYGMRDSYTTATVKETKIENGSVYVTLRDVGDGLVVKGDRIYGCTVCGEDGIYIAAEAELTGNDTIRIYSDKVKNPVSATYACSAMNQRSNVYASENGNTTLAVSPFVTNRDENYTSDYLQDFGWTDCDNQQMWRLQANEYTGYYDVWQGENADVSIDESDSFKGAGGLSVKANDESSFSISPLLTYKDGKKNKCFVDFDSSWNDYSKMSVKVRNNGTEDVTLEELRIYTGKVTYFTPLTNIFDGEKSYVIPADGEWHEIEFSFDRMYLWGNECAAQFSRRNLYDITQIKLCFSKDSDEANLSIDEFEFTPDGTEGRPVRFTADINKADTLLEYICAWFTNFLGGTVGLFLQ